MSRPSSWQPLHVALMVVVFYFVHRFGLNEKFQGLSK